MDTSSFSEKAGRPGISLPSITALLAQPAQDIENQACHGQNCEHEMIVRNVREIFEQNKQGFLN